MSWDFFADASAYQSSINLSAYKRAGHEIIGFKATEGLTYVDPPFARRWRAAGRIGLRRLAYHFARPQPGRSAHSEAAHFLAAVHGAGGRRHGYDLPLVLDIEWTALGALDTIHWCDSFCGYIHYYTGRGCITYTGEWFWGAWRAPKQGGIGWISGYPQLIKPPGIHPIFAHQYSETDRFAGISGPCDGSRVLINHKELVKLCK